MDGNVVPIGDVDFIWKLIKRCQDPNYHKNFYRHRSSGSRVRRLPSHLMTSGPLIRQRLRVRLAMAPLGLIPNAGPESLKILSDGPAFSDVL